MRWAHGFADGCIHAATLTLLGPSLRANPLMAMGWAWCRERFDVVLLPSAAQVAQDPLVAER
jgi:hypothetical protein